VVTRAVPPLSTALSLAFAAVGLGGVGLASAAGLPFAAVGLVGTAVGLFGASRAWLARGGTLAVAGVLVAGARGAAPEPLLVGLLGAVLAWDVGEHGLGLGEQLGREADTARVEVVHAAASLAVGAGATVVGYGTFLAASGGQPVAALVFLLVGVVGLAAALRG
jgi:hypothetical protein